VKRTRSLVALAGAMLTISAVLPGPAFAAPPEKAGAKAATARKGAPTRVLRLEEMKVEGRIQKPQAMFLMPRANMNVGELDRSEPMLPKVSQAVTKPPF